MSEYVRERASPLFDVPQGFDLVMSYHIPVTEGQ
jgi:hypothetical protein